MRQYNAYQIAIPTQEADVTNFYFNSLLPNGTYQFAFSFDDKLNYVIPSAANLWRVFITTPDGTALQAMVAPGNICCPSNESDSFVFTTDLTSVGINELSQVKMYLLQWVK